MWMFFLVAIPFNIIMQKAVIFVCFFLFIMYVRSQTLFTLLLPLLCSGAPDGSSPEPRWEFISRSHVIKSLSKVFESGDDRNCL